MFDLSWMFSIFKLPKISRAVSGCDAQNIRLRHLRHVWKPCYYGRDIRSACNTTFSIPLALTSTCIVKAGLNQIWRRYSKAASQHEQSIIRPPDLVSPSKSHLFLPPSSSPRRKGFNQEFLPTSPSSSTGNVHSLVPVHIPDQKSHDYTVSYSPPFPTPDLPPLSITLLFFPLAAPPPPELIIKIPDDHNLKSQVADFLSSRATENSNSLDVIWQLPHIESGDERGLSSLKSVFAQLDEKVFDSRTTLSRFSKISITIPDQVDLLQPVKEDDNIDLANATDLLEFAWHGDFIIFATKLKNLPFWTLTCLTIRSSNISIEDAITILYSCSGLQTVKLGIIRSMKSSGVERKRQQALPNLTNLTLESDVALHPLIRRFYWTAQVNLSLTLREQGTASLVQALNSGSE